MKWKSFLAAALTAAVALPAWAQDATGGGTPSLSFSFANGQRGARTPVSPSSFDPLGIESVPVANWIDLDDEDVSADNLPINATDVVPADDAHAYNFTLPAPVTVTYSAANGWSHKGTDTRTILQTYLDDGGTGASITVDNVPFTKYDVIVYLATDNGSKFLPVAVNGTKYVGTNTGSSVAANDTATWGTTRQDYATLGTNALKVSGLRTQTLTIQGSSNSAGSGNRCGIAAFQIVQAADGALRTPSISVNMTGDQPSIVGTDGDSGLLSVPNANWNEFSSGGTSESQNRLVDNQGRLTTLAIDATYSGALWNYSSVGRPTLGDMANGYREVTTLDLATVPYSQYDLILYYASDLDGTGSKTPKPWAPVKITSGETVSYYTYTTDHTTGAALKVDEAGAANWGTTASCHDAEQSVAYGGAVMLIEGLSGDIALEMLKNDNNRGGLYGFQIVCTGELLDLVPTISVNIADVRTPNAQGGTLSNPDADIPTTGTYGLAPAPGNTWANLRPATVGTDGTETITKAYACGFATPVRVSYQASGTWEYVGAEGGAPVDSFLRYYLDDGVSANGQKSGADIYVTNIPFSKYDVIVYLATDSDGEKFNPVEINGTLYKGTEAGSEEASGMTDVWGTVRQTTPALGANALRVSGLEGNLRIHGGTKQTVNSQVARGGIAAFQIVLADDGEILESVDPDRGVLSLNFNSNRNNNSSNNSVPNTNAFYGLDAVPGWAWYDSPAQYSDRGTTASSNEETITMAYGPVLDPQPQVTISAANGYGYSSNDPFMRAYLDDNARVNISSEVPYDYYDVIVYSATDGTGSRFQAVGVNGTDYRWNDDQGKPVVAGTGELFGWGGRDAAFGQNAQRINGQTANPLTVSPRTKDGSYRSGIAAIQIIERPVQEITVNTETTAREVFAQALPGRVPKLVFAEGGAITGAVNLSGVAVDLTQVTTSPFTGNLTVDANTKLYLPAGTRTYTLTTGTVTGTLAAGNVFVGGTAIPAGAMMQNGATLTFDIEVTYNWTGAAGNNLWSTAANWSGNAVPEPDSEVTIPLAANDYKTITITEGAVAGSLSIVGPDSGAPTLTINGTGALTVSGQMLTTGNVTVTQNANITVSGKSTMVFPSEAPQAYPYPGAFHVEGAGAKYNVVGGTLSVPTVPEMASGTDIEKTAGGFVTVCGGASLSVGGGDAEAVLSVYRCSMSWPSGDVSRVGTVTVRPRGVLEVAYQSNFASGLTLVTEGGTIRAKSGSVSVSYGNGYAPTSPLTLSAPEGATLTLRAQSSASPVLTGDALVIIDGPGTVAFVGTIDPATYTGEISVRDGTLSIGERRPKLSVVSGAKVLITPTTDETAEGSITFATSMTKAPTGDTFTVSGVKEEITPSVADGVLTLKWKSAMPTLATSGNWSTVDNWTNLADGADTAPTTGTVVLDGTAEGGITVTLDTKLTDMESILVLGDVTLKTTTTQTSIPTCVTPAEGATLTIGANISGASLQSPWELPAGTTLKVTKGFTSFAYLTLNGAVEIAEGVTGSIEAPSAFDGGLTVNASNVTLTGASNVGVTLALNGSNIAIQGSESEGSTFYTDNGTTVVNKGTGNAITGVTGLSGAVAVERGTLRLTLQNKLNSAFPGATIAEGATLTLAGPDNAQGWWFPVTGAGTLVLEGAIRPMFAAVGESTALPKAMVFTATEAEQAAGVISCLNWQNGATLPEGFAVTVYPAPNGGAWVPNAVLESGGNAYLRIYNKLPANLPVGVEDAIANVIQQDATTAGITKGYTVQLTTKGQPVEVTADMLNDVLGCFTGLKPTAEGTKLTYAYDFGIVGIKRNTTGDGWVVTAQVQGAPGAAAGFAKGNYYALTVKVPGETGSERNVNVQTVDESAAATGTVELTVPDTLLEGVDDGFTLGVSVSRTAQQL